MAGKRYLRNIHWEYIFIAAFLIAAMLFVCIRKDDIFIQTFDNLDSNIAWEKMLKDNNLYFSLDGKLPFLSGVDRNNFSSELKCYTWLYILFPPFVAIVVGWFLKILMAMAGFLMVGKAICADYETKKSTILFCGFLYGLLPTFPTSAFCFASLPILLWLMIKLYRTGHWKYMVGVFLYPVLSSATVFGIFACGYIFVFFVIDWIVRKKPAWRLLAAAFILGIGYIITEWRLFYSMLFSGVESIRSTFISEYASFPSVMKTIINSFQHGHDHSGSLHAYVVLPVCGIYFLCLNIGYIRRKEYKKIFCDVYNWLMIWIGFNCVMYGIDNLQSFKALIAAVLPPLSGFSFARTLWFNPFLWYFSFMVVLYRLSKKWLRALLLILAFCVLCVTPATYNTLGANLRLLKAEISGNTYSELTYREFYSEDLFAKIKEDIDYNGEWSIAFGMHPAILQYNAIATLDGYLSMYPAEYKTQFRELIEPNFEEDPNHAWYFDSWGGRAYIFSSEVDFQPVRVMPQTEANMNIDPDVFRQMGGKYVFSRVSVKNASDLGLDEVGIYTSEESPYAIYVYKTI